MQPSTSTSSEDQPGDGATALRAGLIACAAGSALILLGLLGTPARVAGLVAVIAGTVVSAPYADRPGGVTRSWWSLLAAGSLLALAGTAISLGVDSIGGLLSVTGGALIAVGAAMGYPAR